MDVKIRFSSKIPESPKLTISNLPNLIDSCGCSFQRAALIFGQATLILLVISGANSLVTYITHGESIPLGEMKDKDSAGPITTMDF